MSGKTLRVIAPARYIRASGYLQKTKRRRSGATTRFFVLTHHGIYYFKKTVTFDYFFGTFFGTDDNRAEKEEDSSLIPLSLCGDMRGYIKLSQVQRITHVKNEEDGEYYFTIMVSEGSDMTLKSRSKEENEVWVQEIQDAVQQLQKGTKKELVSYPMFPKSKNKKQILLRKGAHCANVVAMGLLEKERDGVIRTGWCTRLFVLTKVALFYFRRSDAKQGAAVKHEKDWRLFGEQRGVLPVSTIQECKTISTDEGFQTFSITFQSGRCLVLRSKSRTHVSEWMDAIDMTRKHVDDVHDDSLSDDTTDEEDEDERRRSFDQSEVISSPMASIVSTSKSLSFKHKTMEEAPSATYEMMYTGVVLFIVNSGIYVLNHVDVFKTTPNQWYAVLVLVNVLIWHLVDQNFEAKHQLVARVSMLMSSLSSSSSSSTTSSSSATKGKDGRKTSSRQGKKKERKNNVKILPLTRGTFDSVDSVVGSCDPKLFKIRSKKYKKTRLKVHSTDDMYEFMTMHSFQSSNRSFNNIVETGNMNLPEPSKELKTRCKNCGVQCYFVVYLKAPQEGISAWSSRPADKVIHFVFVWKIKESFLECLENKGMSTESHRLTQKWFKESPHSVATKNRLKMIAFCENFEILNLGSLFAGYNGKPVMITRSSTIYTGQNYLEVDIDLMVFKKICQVMFQKCLPTASKLKVRIGFTIQGENESELPEQIMACMFTTKPNVHGFSVKDGMGIRLLGAGSVVQKVDNDDDDDDGDDTKK